MGYIGGHGFWGKGGVCTLGVSKKIFVAAYGGRNFFCWPCHQGVNLLNKSEKKLPTPGVNLPKIIFTLGVSGWGCLPSSGGRVGWF